MHAISSLAPSPDQCDAALDRCTTMIEWYEQKLGRAKVLYRFCQTATIVLTALTPVLILAGTQVIDPLFQAIPPALAALLAALMAAYRWRDDWVRYTVAAETLRSEQTKYLTRTTSYYGLALPEAAVLDNFVTRVEQVAASEIADWRLQQLPQAETSAPPHDTRASAPTLSTQTALG